MSFLRAFKLGTKPAAAAPKAPRAKLPELHAFVEIAVNGDARQRESVPVDAIADQTLSTRRVAGVRPGVKADFLYTNAMGRFRFVTTCINVDATQAHFKLPDDVTTLADFSAKRTAVRLDSVVHMQWRYAPDQKGVGEYLKGTMCDLSRGGASVTCGKVIKKDSHIELRFALGDSGPVTIVAQIMRVSKVETSGKYNGGARFVSVDRDAERAINGYIHETQSDRRERGLA